MSSPMYPPPPPMVPPPPVPTGPVAKAPAVGWLAAVAGLFGLLGLFMPWYDPKLSTPLNGVTGLHSAYHAWSGFRILIIAPILLILFAVMWVQAIRGKHNSRFDGSTNPVRSLGQASVLCGALAVILGAVSVVIMKFHYKDWDQTSALVKRAGSTIEKNPQGGLLFTLLGGLILIVLGVVTLVTTKTTPAGSAAFLPAGPQGEFGPPQGGFGPQGEVGPPQGPPQGSPPGATPPPAAW